MSSHLSVFLLKIFILLMGVLSSCMSADHNAHLVPEEGGRSPGNGSYRLVRHNVGSESWIQILLEDHSVFLSSELTLSSQALSLLLDLGLRVASHLMLPPCCQPHHYDGWLYHPQLWANVNPPILKLLLLFYLFVCLFSSHKKRNKYSFAKLPRLASKPLA